MYSNGYNDTGESEMLRDTKTDKDDDFENEIEKIERREFGVLYFRKFCQEPQ